MNVINHFLLKNILFITAVICLMGCKRYENQELSDETSGLKVPKSMGATAASVGGDEFTIAVIPDTQYYIEEYNGGTPQMFYDQINWIKNNKVGQNIVYVVGLGDVVDNGDLKAGSPPTDNIGEWNKATAGYYQLEAPLPGLPHGIPYGIAVGNHDQTFHEYPLVNPNGTTETTKYFNQFFGVAHFAGRAYYGGSYTAREANNNDSHYDLFSAGGKDFIVIYLEYDQKVNQYGTELETWAYNLLGTYSSRKAIIVMHALASNNGTAGTNVGTPAVFYSRAQAVYNKLKSRRNVFMMLGGHVAGNGEGYRLDTYNGRTVKSFVSGYQGRINGGNGWMRLINISVAKDLISIKTFNPHLGTYENDGDSEFKVPMLYSPTASRIFDFNNDGKSQLGFYSNGVWKIAGQSNVTYGTAGYIPVPADYDGDGDTDFGVFNPNNGNWATNGAQSINHGQTGDIPVPADYNGDGRADIAFWRPSTATWYVRGIITQQYGMSNHIPVPADYNGDGKVDFAVFNPSSGNWASTAFTTVKYGQAGDIPVPGDYNGDGKMEIAIFRPSTGNWDSTTMNPTNHGQAGDIPVPGDYDGDGKTDLAVYRPSNKTLYVKNGSTVVLGASGDKILNLPYHIRKFYFP